MKWKAIEGFRFPYRISRDAVVQRQLPNGKWKDCKIRLHGKDYYSSVVAVTMAILPKGYRVVSVISLMEGRWIKKRKKGEVYIRKNGNKMDCSAENLVLKSMGYIPKKFSTRRIAVEKIDKDGNILECYSSISEAARANYMARNAVMYRCRNRVKNPFKLNGFSFQFSR